MLNELITLSKSLSKAGIIPKEWHKNLKPLPKINKNKPCFRIAIGWNGDIVKIDLIQADLGEKLRKWETNLGMSFPGFNIQPLFRVLLSDEEKKEYAGWFKGNGRSVDFKQIELWCHRHETSDWTLNQRDKLKRCLGVTPHELNDQIGEIPVEFECLSHLFNRLEVFKESGNTHATLSLFDNLREHLFLKLKTGQYGHEHLPLLIHSGSTDNDAESDRGSVSIFLDVDDWKEYPVASPETILWLNNAVLANTQTKSDGSGRTDAFNYSLVGYDEKMPAVKMEIIAEVKLRAMSGESQCQSRYGHTDYESFPVGKESRKMLKGALEWLGSPEKYYQTWGVVAPKELLFAYPTGLKGIPPRIAACFGVNRKKEDLDEARFIDLAKDVIHTLSAHSQKLNDIDINIFSLRKMDKARTKVVYYRSYTAQRLNDAAFEWEVGCNNIPMVRLKTWDSNKGQVDFSNPRIPFPLEIANCLNRRWNLDGTSKSIRRFESSIGIELLLNSEIQRQVPHLLSVLLSNADGLLVSLGQTINRGEITKVDGFEAHKLLIPSVIGLLLFKSNLLKINYMNQSSFLLGRLLKVADELHVLYSKEVRKSVPPQLIGNALLNAALNSPPQAISQLGLRINPYLAWAKTNNTDSAGLSRYFLKKFQEIATQLSKQDYSKRLDEFEKAQLFLGYLATIDDEGDNDVETIKN